MNYIIFQLKSPNEQLNSLFTEMVGAATTIIGVKVLQSSLVLTTESNDFDISEIVNNLSNELLTDIKVFISDQYSPTLDIVLSLLDVIPFYQTKVYTNKTLYFNLLNKINNKQLQELILKHYYNNHEMIEIIKAFLKSNQNTTQAAKQLFFHRNTLIGKLDKFKSETGYDLKQFNDAYVIYHILN